jgi:hypothetical protein
MAVTAHKNLKDFHVTMASAVYALVQFLTDEHPTDEGPGWEVVEAYDGADLDTPSGGTKLADLPSDNAWQTGPLTSTGSWIVLRSLGGSVATKFQLYIEYGATSQMQYLLIPFDDFATGVGGSPPTFPSTAFGTALGTLVTYQPFGNGVVGHMYAVADEGMVAFVTDSIQPVSLRWFYAGEVDQFPGQSSSDARPFILMDNPTTGFDDDSSLEVWNRISPFDDTTLITNGHVCFYKIDEEGQSIHSKQNSVAGSLSTLGVNLVSPVPILWDTTSHTHIAGMLRNVFCADGTLGMRQTINNKKMMTLRDWSAAVYQNVSIAFNWDGVRNIPSAE